MPAGGGISMAFTPVGEAGPTRKMAVAGAAIELATMHKVENDHGLLSEPFHKGRPGKLMRAAKACISRGHRALRGDRAQAVEGGRVRSAVSRSWGRPAGRLADVASTKDAKYVVVPQWDRMATREAERASIITR